MRTAAISLAFVFEVARGMAFAQGAGEPPPDLRACALMEPGARLECLERLSRGIAPPARPAPAADGWLVSETTSPVDYMPIVTATTFSRGAPDGSSMQLSIRCRSGRTELVITGPAVASRNGEAYAISYRINDGPPVQLAPASTSFGTGATFKGDVVRLLQSFPEEGDISFRLSTRTGAALQGHFFLGGLKTVREKLAAACKWPHAVAGRRN